jgi:uncharacterized protein
LNSVENETTLPLPACRKCGFIVMSAARAILVALLLCWASLAAADVAVPQLTGRVVDQTATLSSDDIASLTQTIRNLELRKGSQIAVLIVPTTQPESIEQFSIRVAETWKIGRKKIDDGALLVVAKNDHKLRIEVGYGLEGALTDVTARRIIDEVITPKFRSGDFAGGISAGVARIIAVIDGEPLPAPAPEASHGQDFNDWIGFFNPINPFFIIGVGIVGVVLRTAFGRLIGSAATGGVIGALAWYLLGSSIIAVLLWTLVSVVVFFADVIQAASRNASGQSGRRGGWSGGSYSGGGGGWSSSSSSDSSSSGGGGGSFGGGGASGSW